MDRTGSSQTEAMPKIGTDDVRPLIESFFQRMTVAQQELLKLGSADDATKVMLAELILDIITSVSKSVLATNSSLNSVTSEESVLSSLGNTLPLTFAEVLDIKDQVLCASSDRLNNMIVKEIAESVSSAICASVDTVGPVFSERVTPPDRLDVMVSHGLHMLKAFKGKMKALGTRRSRTSPPIQVDTDQEVANSDDRCQSAARSVESKTSRRSEEDSLVIATTKAVQDIIRKEVSGITEPLLNDMKDSEYELLQSDTSLEIDIIADDIAHSIVEELKSLEESNETSESREELSVQGVEDKIKTFLATRFAKLSIYRVAAQLKTKFYLDSEVEGRDSMQSLIADVDSLLLTEDGEKQQGGNEVVLRRLQNISNGRVLVFTKQLSDLLYNHTTKGAITEIVPGVRRIVVSPPRDAMYGEIQGKVWRFLGLMRWWLATQAAIHSDRVTLALKDPKSVSPTPHSHTQAEKNKMSVRIIVEKLVSRTFNKAKISSDVGNAETIIKRLFEKTWAKVEGADFDITPETFKRLDKAVFKDLCKKWGCAKTVLVSMSLNEPAVENCIASTFKDHLMTPTKKGSAIFRFFSSVSKDISKPLAPEFRRRAWVNLQKFGETCQKSCVACSMAGGTVLYF